MVSEPNPTCSNLFSPSISKTNDIVCGSLSIDIFKTRKFGPLSGAVCGEMVTDEVLRNLNPSSRDSAESGKTLIDSDSLKQNFKTFRHETW